jgi:hypothetical protein
MPTTRPKKPSATKHRHSPPKPWPKAPTKPPAGVSRTCAQAFDEWMRRYLEEPERFPREFQSIAEFISQGGLRGGATSYGRQCGECLRRLMGGG